VVNCQSALSARSTDRRNQRRWAPARRSSTWRPRWCRFGPSISSRDGARQTRYVVEPCPWSPKCARQKLAEPRKREPPAGAVLSWSDLKTARKAARCC
jgi:hypothetical protein